MGYDGRPRYSRVLLKISGEALMGAQPYGIDIDTVDRIAADVADAVRAGTQICLVIGGGNIFRGLAGGGERGEGAPPPFNGGLGAGEKAPPPPGAAGGGGGTTPRPSARPFGILRMG